MTLTGTNFTGATAVKLNGVSVPFTVISATSIVLAVPVGAATGRIAVTTAGGTATSATNFTASTTPVIPAAARRRVSISNASFTTRRRSTTRSVGTKSTVSPRVAAVPTHHAWRATVTCAAPKPIVRRPSSDTRRNSDASYVSGTSQIRSPGHAPVDACS